MPAKIKNLLLAITGVFLASVVMAVSNEVLNKINAKYGSSAVNRIEQWQYLIKTSAGLTEREKLKKVNDFFNNHLDFVNDEFLWGKEDYWATPLESLARGAGDCEDYSIAKYFTLREIGVPDAKIRITYVKALELNQAHMVLTFFDTPAAIPLVLDNLMPEIKRATKRRDLLPVYSFNGSGLWLAKARGSGKRVGKSSRLSKWGDVKNKIMESKF